MKLKLNYIITLLILFSSFTLMAQRPSMEEIKAKLRSDKVAYLTTRISLTPEEAEKFWPVYNEFDDKRIDIQMARFSLDRKIMRNNDSLSDEEIVKFLQESTNSKKEEEELNVKYYEKFLKILPPKKVFALYQVEKEFLTFLNNSRGNRNNFNMMNR
jgi:hypothetical protein